MATTNFCVVCVCENDVHATPFWGVETEKRTDAIALAVAAAAERFGHPDFDVRVVEIKA